MSLSLNERGAIAALARQPATLKAVEAERARVIAERQARLEKIGALDAKATFDWPAGQSSIKAAATKVRDAERRLREANQTLSDANAAAWNSSAAYTKARQVEELALIAGADHAAIAAWKTDLLDELEALRRPGSLQTFQTNEQDAVTRKVTARGFTNAPSIRARISAISEAFREADLLALEPDQSRIPERVAAARASWPKITDTAFGAQEQKK